VRYALVDAGDPAPVMTSSSAPSSARPVGWLERGDLSAGTALQLDLPADEELLVWAHRVTDDGDSLALPLNVTAGANADSRPLDLTGGRLTLAPIAGPRVLVVRSQGASPGAGRAEATGDAPWAALAKRSSASEATA
jgi:hypothetical protein